MKKKSKIPQPKPTPSMTSYKAKRCVDCEHELIVKEFGFFKKTKIYICNNNHCNRYGLQTFVFKNWGYFKID
jgi:hypothetical protein